MNATVKHFFYALAFTALIFSASFAQDSYRQELAVVMPQTDGNRDCIVLMHGLARTSSSMSELAEQLQSNGYIVVNIDYPSREHAIDVLASHSVSAGLRACEAAQASRIGFVTHSLGGILLRAYAKANPDFNIYRAVMLGPPNNGSEVVDAMRDLPGFKWLNGPAGQQLGAVAGVPSTLGPAPFELAVIAGTSTINPILSSYLPDPDDGKVSVASTKLDNMCAHLQINVAHPFLMKDDKVIDETINYLLSGRFLSADAEYPECSFRESG